MRVKNDIRKLIVKNCIVVYGLLGAICFCMFINYQTNKAAMAESREYLYAVMPSGELCPMKWHNRRDNIDIEIKHHLQMLVDNFYSLTQYNWEQKVEKALWLGDFENLHNERANKGYYNGFIQYDVVQNVILSPENIEIKHQEDGSISFYVEIGLEITKGATTKRLVKFIKGQIKEVDRNYPLNPHGLYIYDYVEEKTFTKDE